MKKYLLIDTVSERDTSTLKWLDGDYKVFKETSLNSKRLFPILKKVRPSEISGVIVVSGPGEFSVVRQGIVFANALAWALKVKIKAIKIGEHLDNKGWSTKFVQPLYLRPANITVSKKP